MAHQGCDTDWMGSVMDQGQDLFRVWWDEGAEIVRCARAHDAVCGEPVATDADRTPTRMFMSESSALEWLHGYRR